MTTVKELKKFVANIPNVLDDREIVTVGYGQGYNPVSDFNAKKTLVKHTSPKDENEEQNKYVVVFSIT